MGLQGTVPARLHPPTGFAPPPEGAPRPPLSTRGAFSLPTFAPRRVPSPGTTPIRPTLSDYETLEGVQPGEIEVLRSTPQGAQTTSIIGPSEEIADFDLARITQDIFGQGLDRLKNQRGMYNTDIEHFMDQVPGFLGVYSADEIYKMVPLIAGLKSPVFSFVWNLDNSDKPGIHWNACYCDARTKTDNPNAQSVEIYDSFAREPTHQFLKQLKLLIDELVKRFSVDYYLKFKVNRIVDQRTNSNDCGWFAMKFIVDRMSGIPFVDATGYSNVETATKSMDKFKQKLIKFGYIYKPHRL